MILFQELSIKTRELLNNLSSLAPEGEKITLELLHARKLTPATETFLYSLASAEGLAQLWIQVDFYLLCIINWFFVLFIPT